MCTEKRALLSILLLFIINVIIVIILIIGAFVYYDFLFAAPLYSINSSSARTEPARCLPSRAAARAQIANTLHGSIASLALPPLLGFRNPKNLRVKFSPAVSVFLLIAEENETTKKR